MSYVPETIDYDMYAKMDYWNFGEAIWLTVSYKLSHGTYSSKDEYVIEYNKEYNKIAMILYRSIESNASQLREFSVVFDDYNLPLLNMSYVPPFWFVKWIKYKRYDLPSELKEIELTDFSVSHIQDMVERDHDDYLGLIHYEIEGAELMSESEIEEKMNEIDLKTGRTSRVSTLKSTNVVQNEPNNSVFTSSKIMENNNQQYRFEKVGKSWNIQYGDAVLLGVKDWLGMTYIKYLLENPGVKIGVLDLQQLAGESDNGGQQNYEQSGFGDEYAEKASYDACVEAWEDLDVTAKKSYRSRLEVISTEIADARNRHDQIKIDTLIREAEFIQKELQSGCFKPKDPEIDKNRKRVLKSIKDTIASIKKLEALCNYNDKPISGHLTRCIKTGVNCSYNVDDDFPGWRF